MLSVHPDQQAQMHQMMMHQQMMEQQAMHEQMLHQQMMHQQMMHQQQAMMEHHQRMSMESQQWQQQQQHQQQQHQAGSAATPHAAGSVPAHPWPAVYAHSSAAASSHPHARPGAAHATHETPRAAHALAKHQSFFLIWPESSSAAYTNLMNLKRTLDLIARTAEPTSGQQILLKNALEAVTNSPRPAAQQVQILANDISNTIATRGLPELDTRALALQFRALMNGAHLSRPEIEQTLTDNRLVWSASSAAPPQINVVAGDLQTIAMQFQSRPE
jgi:hypothetical protein